MSVVVVIFASCVACLQSFFFQKEFFGELLNSFPAPQFGFFFFLRVILSDLSKLSLSFKAKT